MFTAILLDIIVKLLDWGEDGIATTAETTALRSSFRQEVAVWHKLDHPNVTKVQTYSETLITSIVMTTSPFYHKHKVAFVGCAIFFFTITHFYAGLVFLGTCLLMYVCDFVMMFSHFLSC